MVWGGVHGFNCSWQAIREWVHTATVGYCLPPELCATRLVPRIQSAALGNHRLRASVQLPDPPRPEAAGTLRKPVVSSTACSNRCTSAAPLGRL